MFYKNALANRLRNSVYISKYHEVKYLFSKDTEVGLHDDTSVGEIHSSLPSRNRR